MKQFTHFICQEPYQSLSVLDYPNISAEPIYNPTRYQALRNDKDLLVLHLTPVRNPGPQSISLCQGILEADLLPLMDSFSVTELVSMFFIEASGRDVVYRSRNCLQIVTNIFHKRLCDSCTGLIENIKNREGPSPSETENLQEICQEAKPKPGEPLNLHEVAVKMNIEEPLIINFSRLNDLDEKLREIPDEIDSDIDNKRETSPPASGQESHEKTRGLFADIGKLIKCPFCEKVGGEKHRKRLVEHVKRQHLSEADTETYTNFILDNNPKKLKPILEFNYKSVTKTIIKCPFCEELFRKGSKKSVKHVKFIHHSEKESQSYKNFFLENPPQICKKCGKTFESIQNFHVHSKQCVHGEKEKEKRSCHICGKIVSNIHEHIKLHDVDEPSSCDICGKSFNNLMRLRTHFLVCRRRREPRYNVKDIKCNECGKTFTQRTFPEHLKRHDKSTWKHECEKCGKKYFAAKVLKEHMIAVHDKIKPYICNLCGFKTAKLGNLNLHRQKSHGGPASYFKPSTFWELIENGKHPYIAMDYQYIHLLKTKQVDNE